ncbi:MAG: dephospho-CoA kinase [Anaerolineae bacterium]|nr:dephospho-CoA kinase [Anaerolineae bacterium]
MCSQERTGWLEALQRTGLLVLLGGGITFRHEWLRAALSVHEAVAPRPDDKVLLGLTGNIAVGKSTVLGMMEALGAAIIDADALVHDLRAPGAPGYGPLVDLLGEEVLQADGRISRSKLAQRAFADPALLAQLEAIFHPLVQQEVARRIAVSDRRIVVIEAIKLLEGRLKHIVEAVWVVDASHEMQFQRLMTTRGLSHEQAVARIVGQNPQAEKLALADVIIHNDGDLAATWKQVSRAWAELLARLWQGDRLDSDLARRFVLASLDHALPDADTAQLLAFLVRLAEQMPPQGTLPAAQFDAPLADGS